MPAQSSVAKSGDLDEQFSAMASNLPSTTFSFVLFFLFFFFFLDYIYRRGR
jgi:hypothetical protein